MKYNLIVDLISGARHHVTYSGDLDDCRAMVANQFGTLNLMRVWLQSPDDLLPAVEQALNPTEEMKAKLNEYRNYFFTGLDGKSGGRVKTKIDEIMGV